MTYGMKHLGELSKRVFDDLEWGQDPMDHWSFMQLQLAQWAQRLYGAQPFERMVLGICEEMGELSIAGTTADRKDAVADITVFSMQLCTTFRLDYATLLVYSHRDAPMQGETPMLTIIRMLNQIALKTLQGTRGLGMSGEGWDKARSLMAETISDLAHNLNLYASTCLGDYFSIVQATAIEVMKRTKNLPAIT